jgi:hypothetical protein
LTNNPKLAGLVAGMAGSSAGITRKSGSAARSTLRLAVTALGLAGTAREMPVDSAKTAGNRPRAPASPEP